MAGLDVKVGDSQRLAVLGKEISMSFDLLFQSDFEGQLQDYAPADWEHEAEKFSLWANNLGLHHRGHSSLDYRLREAKALRNLIGDYLTDLKTSLDELNEAAVDGGCLQRGSAPDDGFPEDETSAESENSSDEDFASSEATAKVLLSSVADIIDNLYRLATKIRDPASRLPSSKARLFKKADPETGVDFIEKIKAIDAIHIEEVFLEYRALKPADVVVSPEATLEANDRVRKPRELDDGCRIIIARMAQANTYRRQQFGHWRKHRDKNAKETLKELDRQQALPSMNTGSPESRHQNNFIGGPQFGPRTLAALSKPSTASYLRDPSRFGDDDGRSSTSRRTITPKALDPRDEQIDVPPPPPALKETAKKEKHFVCPYCFTICSVSQLQPDAWREHVFRDLRPYVCTYTDCEKGDQLYDSWKDWTTHERWAHTRVWRCAIHPSETHYSALSFKEHLQKDHSISSELNHQQLNSVSARLDETVTRDCPFCLCSIEDKDHLQNHIGTHLQKIALFALPRSTDIEDDSEEDDSSNKANRFDQASQQMGSQEGVEDIDDIVDFNEALIALARSSKIEDDPEEGDASDKANRLDQGSQQPGLHEGVEDIDKMASMRKLVSTLCDQGRWDEAEKLEEQVWDMKKRVLGTEHSDTLHSMAKLGKLYAYQGKMAEAQAMFQRALIGYEKILGPEHKSTLQAMTGLRILFAREGRMVEAEKLQVRVIEISKRVLGEEHPSTLRAMDTLASLYSDQKRYDEAEVLLVQVIEISTKVLGAEHQDTLASIAGLVSIYFHQERWNEAEVLQLQAMEIRRRVLGEEHPDTLAHMVTLPSIYFYQKRWKEAEALQLQVIEIRRRVLGEEHPATIASMANLALTLQNQERYKEAEALQLQVVERRRVLVEEHPERIASVASLAIIYFHQKRWTEAEALQLQVREIRRRVLGEEHPQTIASMASLALIYQSQERWKEAEEMQERAVELCQRGLGAEHPDTLAYKAHLAEIRRSIAGGDGDDEANRSSRE